MAPEARMPTTTERLAVVEERVAVLQTQLQTHAAASDARHKQTMEALERLERGSGEGSPPQPRRFLFGVQPGTGRELGVFAAIILSALLSGAIGSGAAGYLGAQAAEQPPGGTP